MILFVLCSPMGILIPWAVGASPLHGSTSLNPTNQETFQNNVEPKWGPTYRKRNLHRPNPMGPTRTTPSQRPQPPQMAHPMRETEGPKGPAWGMGIVIYLLVGADRRYVRSGRGQGQRLLGLVRPSAASPPISSPSIGIHHPHVYSSLPPFPPPWT